MPISLRSDCVVVGASFAGLACATALGHAGRSVIVAERKADAGEKLHTTGIIVKDAIDSIPLLADVPAALTRRIDGVCLYAPSMRYSTTSHRSSICATSRRRPCALE